MGSCESCSARQDSAVQCLKVAAAAQYFLVYNFLSCLFVFCFNFCCCCCSGTDIDHDVSDGSKDPPMQLPLLPRPLPLPRWGRGQTKPPKYPIHPWSENPKPQPTNPVMRGLDTGFAALGYQAGISQHRRITCFGIRSLGSYL